MMDANVGGVFMPHGLGHFLGLDTHDVGGYLGDSLPRDTRRGFASLRTTRTLAPGMVITVEPGCYLIDSLLDKAFADPSLVGFFNVDKINAEYRSIGGVRLEDNVVIRPHGIENMVFVPRSIDQVEAVCAGHIDRRDGFALRFQGAEHLKIVA